MKESWLPGRICAPRFGWLGEHDEASYARALPDRVGSEVDPNAPKAYGCVPTYDLKPEQATVCSLAELLLIAALREGAEYPLLARQLAFTKKI